MKKIILTIFIFLSMIPLAKAISYDLIVVRADIPTEYTIASVYANYMKIPVVLVNPNEIPIETKRELFGYVGNYRNILIIGGKEAISFGVENELKEMGFNVGRLWDWNRYGTAARAAIELWDKSDSAVIVDGENYQNLLLAQRFALKNNLPILFIKNFSIPVETRSALRRLETKKIYLFEEKIEDDLEIPVEMMTVEKMDFEEEKEGMFNWMFFASTGFIAFILLSFYLWKRRSIPSEILTKEERKIINVIKKGDIKQNQLPAITGFSKPKVSRLLQNLERRKIIKRKGLKRTYIVELGKKIS